MKTSSLLVCVALLLGPCRVRAAEHRYDVVAKLFTPFISVFAQKAKSPNRAMVLVARVEELTDLPPALVGTRLELSVQSPDKLRLKAPILGEEVTVARRGQKLWAAPGAKIQPLLDRATADKKLPPPDPSFRLAPFALPIPEKQLVFLPALLQVRDAGVEMIDGEQCRVLDLQLMPELERGLKEKGWTARVWVRRNYRPARLLVTNAQWRAVLAFERVEFSPQLPPETWAAPGDAVQLDPARYEQLWQALTR